MRQSQNRELRFVNLLLVAMLVILLLTGLLPMTEFLPKGTAMPLWLHTASETFAIVIAMLIFGVVWNSYKVERHSNLLILACGLLAVALLDFVHMLSFLGMPHFVTPSGIEKSINFWLAARLIEVLTLLAVAIKPWRPLRNSRLSYGLLAASLAVTALFIWLGMFHEEKWPRTFIEGQGLTPFKIYSEYAFCLVLLCAGCLFYRAARQEQALTYDATSLYAASVITIMSELCFAFYQSTIDVIALIGHLYKIIAYMFICRAVFSSSVRQPYERLRQAQEKLASSQQLLQSILDNAPVRIFWRDRYLRYLGANALYLQDAGFSNIEQILGKKNAEIFPEHTDKYAHDDLHVMDSGIAKLNYEEPITRANGEKGWLLTSKVPLRNQNGDIIGILGTYNDITERKRAEETIQYQADYDLLTQLPNRRLFQKRLQEEITNCQRNRLKLALILLDLDNFKEINDTLGHAVGDDLLRRMAGRLRNAVGESNFVARLGGDEFIIIVNGIQTMPEAELVAQKIMNRLCGPFQLDGEIIYATVSIGLTIYPDDAQTRDSLLRNADHAMYDAKQQGRNRYSCFTPAMQQAALNRVQLIRDLRGALAEDQFSVVYQPIVEFGSGEIFKAEALLRWQHPERGFVSPAEFIPVAESAGLIIDIGDWVFRQVTQQLKSWRLRNPRIQVSINKSPVQFSVDNQRHQAWFEHLHALGLPGSSIAIEITEGLLLDASGKVTQILEDCHDAGMQVALDDFGTGYSSLSYLKKFNIDYLKIDKTFVGNLAIGSEDMALCEAIIGMAHKLDIQVIAEGVETETQRDLLIAAGCDFGQGYLFAKPLQPEEFERLL